MPVDPALQPEAPSPGPCLLIFGGSFDPPHRAHTTLPPLVAARRGCDRILYVPTAINPLKGPAPTPACHRLAMLQRALRAVPGAELSTIELEREGPSYTVDTLRQLRGQYPAPVAFHLLIGADAALGFHRWRDPGGILELATPAVMLRPPLDEATLSRELAAHWSAHDVDRWLGWTVTVPALDISSTEVRRRLAAGDDVSDVVSDEVAAYVRDHGLYREEATKRRGDGATTG